MTFARRILAASILALIPSAQPVFAAFEAYLNIPGVEGEATDATHPNWIQVTSFAGNATAPGPLAPAQFSSLCFTKRTDKSSPILHQKSAQGVKFPSVSLEALHVSGDRSRFYAITLTNVFVSSIKTAGSAASSSDFPIEQLCLSFSSISWVYTQFDAKGLPENDIAAWWNLLNNIGSSSIISRVFRVTGAQISAGQLQISWTAQAGKSYSIFNSIVLG